MFFQVYRYIKHSLSTPWQSVTVHKGVSLHVRIHLYMNKHSQRVCMAPQHGTGCVKDNNSLAYICTIPDYSARCVLCMRVHMYHVCTYVCVLVHVCMCCVCLHVIVSSSAEYVTSPSEERASHVSVPTSNASFGTRERHHFGMCRSMW